MAKKLILSYFVQSKLNCEVLWDDLAYEVRWAVAGDSVVLQLVARLEAGEYMSFGISGDARRSKMVGGDVTVAYVDKETLKGHALDYYLDAKSQCSGARGSCPDENIVDKTNSVRLLNAALVNGYSIVTFQRSLKAQDEFDREIFTNTSQPIIWAIGPLNARQEVSYHSIANRADILLDFGRPPKWNCPTPEAQSVPSAPEPAQVSRNRLQTTTTTTEVALDTRHQSSNRRESSRPRTPTATPAPTPKVKPWDIPAIQCYEPEDGVFYAQMGPTGGKRGYSAITGHVGWGISWYINGLLIPEIDVVRGRTYTFIVEGGLNPDTPARYHPFYITDDPVGGYEYKTPEERAQVQIFAGAVQNKKGEVRPTGVGRLCNWTPDQKQPQADEFASFGAYQRTLRLECDQGEPGIVQWTVAKDTPDTVYYQCYTHRYLGWKINVLDDCEQGAGSEPEPVFIRPPQIETKSFQVEPEAQASFQHISKVRPESNANQIQASHPINPFDANPPPHPFELNQPQVPVNFVPEFHFYNEDTGEPLDQETIKKMNLDKEIDSLQSQFYQNQAVEQQSTNPIGLQQSINPIGFQQSINPTDFQQSINPTGLQQTIHPIANQQSINPNNHQQPIPTSHQQINFKNNEEFINFFHTPKPIPKPPMYSVEEHPEDEPPALPSQQFQLAHQTERPSFLPTTNPKLMHYEATTVLDDKFNQEFLKNYHELQAEAAAKLKKHNLKMQHHYSKPARLQYSAPRRPSSSHHAVTLQQRPLPPGMFRPPFLPPPTKKSYSKRPGPVGAASQNIPTYASINHIPNRPNNYIRPVKTHRPSEPMYKVQVQQQTLPTPAQILNQHAGPVNVQQVFALQKLLSTMLPESTIFPTTPIYHDQYQFPTKATPLAVNTGFNPSSVKVEGGFKPILNTGIAPTFKVAEERMDDMVDEDDLDYNVGVVDLTKLDKNQEEAEEKSNVFIEKEDNQPEEKDEAVNKTTQEEDIFKHLKPVMFEPMFVPSPPDTRIQKNPTKRYKKKPIHNKYSANIKNRNNHLEPFNGHKNKYIKIRPRPNLIRRPLYPNNVMPPFKIPVRGGSPQFRYQEDDESVENTTDFDIIQMNNDSISIEDDSAENIFEVIEMQSENNSTEQDKMEVVVINNEDGEVFDSEFKVKNSTEDEIAMADERRDFYLPPDKPKGSVTYDGKVVSAIAAPSLPETKRKFDISKLPQFAPFRGELPSFPQSSSIADLPQVRESTAARSDILPPIQRSRRSPDHIPGHVGDDHEHHDHNHDHHDHLEGSTNQATTYCFSLILLAPFLIITRFL